MYLDIILEKNFQIYEFIQNGKKCNTKIKYAL
jgi:hypothetical protein